MYVTVVRNQLPSVVSLPGGVHIREHNFVEIKPEGMDEEMKTALVRLERAGSVKVAQVADISSIMMEGKWDAALPTDTTGQPSPGLHTSTEDQMTLAAKQQDKPDILTDYSKPHAWNEEQKAAIDERTKRADEAGGAADALGIAQTVRMITTEDIEKARGDVGRRALLGARPQSVEHLDEQLEARGATDEDPKSDAAAREAVQAVSVDKVEAETEPSAEVTPT